MNNKKIIILLTIILISILFFLPAIFIKKEGQKCFIDAHCVGLKNTCEQINKKITKEDIASTKPICINYKCKCEWYGNLLKFKQ